MIIEKVRVLHLELQGEEIDDFASLFFKLEQSEKQLGLIKTTNLNKEEKNLIKQLLDDLLPDRCVSDDSNS